MSPSNRSATAPRLSGDGGTTLVEILMAVIILGFAGVSILLGLGAAVRGSDIHGKQARVGVAAVSAAERLKDPALARVPCATPTTPSYLAAVRSIELPAGWTAGTTVRIREILYSNGSGFTATCFDTPALGHALRAQLITLDVQSPDGRARTSVVVAKGTQL